MLSPAKLCAPSAAIRSMTVAVLPGTQSARMAEPQLQRRPAW